MIWAYVMENGFGAEEHSNQPVFELIQKVGVSDEQIVFEQTEDRPELRKLLERLHEEDILIVRSVADLADDVINLIRVFQTFATSEVSHIGIYVGDGMMIHAGNPIQYTSVNTNYWQSHFYAYGRLGGN